MDVRMPDGTIVRNVPEGTTQAELASMLKASGKSTVGIGVKPQNKYDYGFGSAMLQGLTMGASDEAIAKIDAMRGKGTYSQNLLDLEAAKQAYEDQNPLTSVAGELVGGIPTMAIGGLGLMKGASTLLSKSPQLAKGAAALGERIAPTVAKVSTAAVTGAGNGAITGANTAKEDDRLGGALRGAGIGAIFGPLTTAVGPAAQAVIDKAQGVPVLGAIGRGIGNVTPGLTGDFAERGDIKLLQSIRRDNMRPSEGAATLEGMAMGPRAMPEKPMTITDVFGENTLRLADVASLYPGASANASKALRAERQGGQLQRTTGDLADAFGANGKGSVADISAELKALREQQAGPLYQKAYAEGRQLTSPKLRELFDRPGIQQAYQRARAIAAESGTELPGLEAFQKLKVDNFTGRTYYDTVDLQTLNMVKRGLDDVIFNAKQPTSNIGKEQLGALNQTRVELLKELDKLVPTYAKARQAFAGPAALDEALTNGMEFGAKLNSEKVGNLRVAMSKMTGAEKEHFTLGLMEGIQGNLRQVRDGRDLIPLVFGSPEKRDIIREAVGKEKFDSLFNQMQREIKIRNTDDFIRGNSQTQRRAFGTADMEADTGAVASVVQSGPLRGMTDYILRSATGPGQATADALANPLFSTNLSEQLTTLNRLSNLDNVLRQRAIRQGVGSGMLSGLPGLLGD